jgi:Domain of unknown function (DUF5916)/Carbohydrate family 9 binding domain-like
MNCRIVVLGLSIAAAVAFSSAAEALADGSAYQINAPDPATPPVLDGTLSDPAWTKAAHVTLDHDIQFQRPAQQHTDAYFMVDDKNLYVAFVAKQQSDIVATQHTNDVGENSDDEVAVRLWPDGGSGFAYRFGASPIGTRYQSSTENSSYAPTWTAVGKVSAGQYVVTMRIPLNVLRGAQRKTWRLQFSRLVQRTGEVYCWAYDKNMGGTNDVVYAGYLNGMHEGVVQGEWPKSRVALYSLGAVASHNGGGNGIHSGADIAIPITRTASLVATLHPDFSNVDADQQSISPTEFQRSFAELRPFFTQLSNYFNNLNCNGCIDIPPLYTPGIPTPITGYAAEGRQGPVSFAGFDAIGTGRTDQAQALAYQTPDKHDQIFYQRVGVAMPGFSDISSFTNAIVGNYHNFNIDGSIGGDSGTFVRDSSQAQYRELDVNDYSQFSGVFLGLLKVGPQYAPFDGFTAHNGIAGYNLSTYKQWNFSPQSGVTLLNLNPFWDVYHDSNGVVNQGDSNFYMQLKTRTLFRFVATTGHSYLMNPEGASADFNQNGVALAYRGDTSTPITASYNIGRFGNGYLRTWARSDTMAIGSRGTFTLEADDTRWTSDSFHMSHQWLERASVAYQLGPESSFSVGLRRILGSGPPDGFSFLNGAGLQPGPYTSAYNVSFAYHRRWAQNELYTAYGDPNLLYTKPAFVLKLIRYIGAEKGT